MESSHFWFAGRRVLVERLLRRAIAPAARLLDVGCGTGDLAARLAALGHSVVGVDLAFIVKPSGTPARADATRLPFASQEFDGALLLDLLEHGDDGAMLDETARVLRPGGVALVTVPALPWLWSHRDEAAGHRRRYDERGLRTVLARAGLRVEALRWYTFALFPLMVASRWLGRRGPSMRDREDAPPPRLNAVLGAVSRAEARVGVNVRFPIGSSLVALARKGRRRA